MVNILLPTVIQYEIICDLIEVSFTLLCELRSFYEEKKHIRQINGNVRS